MANAVPAAYFAVGAYARFLRFYEEENKWNPGHILLAFQLSLVICFFILFMVRRVPGSVSWNPWDVTVSLLGTFAPFLFQLEVRPNPYWQAYGVQGVGSILTIMAVITLGRSIGILPANRGIKTKGLYGLVRHPMYFS